MRSKTMRGRKLWGPLYILAAATPLLSGCSESATTASAVDAPRALEVLKTALDAWKKGQAIDGLKSGSPPIVAQDFDWMGGAKLVGYEVDGEGSKNDVNLRVPVKLTLKPPQGPEIKKSVSYVVGTSPALTVFREFP